MLPGSLAFLLPSETSRRKSVGWSGLTRSTANPRPAWLTWHSKIKGSMMVSDRELERPGYEVVDVERDRGWETDCSVGPMSFSRAGLPLALTPHDLAFPSPPTPYLFSRTLFDTHREVSTPFSLEPEWSGSARANSCQWKQTRARPADVPPPSWDSSTIASAITLTAAGAGPSDGTRDYSAIERGVPVCAVSLCMGCMCRPVEEGERTMRFDHLPSNLLGSNSHHSADRWRSI